MSLILGAFACLYAIALIQCIEMATLTDSMLCNAQRVPVCSLKWAMWFSLRCCERWYTKNSADSYSGDIIWPRPVR